MCVQCVAGATVGFGILQACRYVIKDRARTWLSPKRWLHATQDAAVEVVSRSAPLGSALHRRDLSKKDRDLPRSGCTIPRLT